MILALLLVSLFIALGYVISALVVFLLVVFERRLLVLPPELRTKIYRRALYAPCAGAALLLATVLAPSFLELAGIAGHCDIVAGHHVHLCFLHFSARAGFAIVFLGGVLTLGTAVRGLRSIGTWARERRAVLSLVRTGRPRAGVSGTIVFDSEVPVCVTLGLRKPRIFLSTAAIRALGLSDLDAALEHERAHALRRDDLALLIGRFAALLHFPSFGPRLLARWQQETEIVCDAFAARRTGAPADLAGAIVRFHRALMELRRAPPCAGACLCQTSAIVLDRRVRALLEDSSEFGHASGAGRLALGAGLVLLALGLLLQARNLHHTMESALGLLGVIH